MATAGEDQRKTQRITWPLPVTYRTTIKRGLKQTAQCVNISGGGLQILTARPLLPQTQVDVRLDSRKAGIGVLKAVCMVRWRRGEAGRYRIGLKLVSVTPREAWEHFLCETLLEVSLP